MGRLLYLLVAAGLVTTGGQAAAALPLDVLPAPLVREAGCAGDSVGREAARHAVREARERHGAVLAQMLGGHPNPKAAEAILQADAMLAHIGTEADGALVAHGACAAGEVVRRALSAMDTVAGLAPPAVAAAEATPRPTARPVYRPAPQPAYRPAQPGYRPTPRPTPRPLPLELFKLHHGPWPVFPQKSR